MRTCLFEFDCSGLRGLGVRPRSVSGEKTVTWFSGYRYYGGFEYQRGQKAATSASSTCWISGMPSSASLRRKCQTTGRSRRSRRRQSARAPMPRLQTRFATQALTSVQQQTVRPIAARHSPGAPTRRRKTRERLSLLQRQAGDQRDSPATAARARGAARTSGAARCRICRASSILMKASVAWRFSRYCLVVHCGRRRAARGAQVQANTDIGQVQNVCCVEYGDTGSVIAITFEDPGQLHRAA